MLLGLSDQVLQSIVLAVQTIITALLTPLVAWIVYYLSKIYRTGEKSHDLANSFMLEQKRKTAEFARGKANFIGTAIDIAIAESEEQAYLSHKETDDRMKAQGAIKSK